MWSSIRRALKQYLKTTTLHGFKYLASPYWFDRLCWIVGCIASACCAGTLSAVLWARFEETPALLMSRELRLSLPADMPTFGVCLDSRTTANLVADRLIANNTSLLQTNSSVLANLIHRLLERKPVPKIQLLALESLLLSHNMTLSEAIMEYTPKCSELLMRCRLQNDIMACDNLVEKELVGWAGVCCLMRGSKTTELIKKMKYSTYFLREAIDVILHNVIGTDRTEYQFFTRYPGEDLVSPSAISSGSYNFVQLSFVAVQDNDPESLVVGACVSDSLYYRSRCRVQCRERACGCSDPLGTPQEFEKNVLPQCTPTQMTCLGRLSPVDDACHCKPACRYVTSFTSIRALPLQDPSTTYDPIFAGMNQSAASALSLRVRISASKVFERASTETWLSLLSSLGGVFNMFLGVGLFSALEFLYFLFVRLPLAIKTSTEMANTVTALPSRY